MSRQLPPDPLQRALILWLEDQPNLSELARKILTRRGALPEESTARRIAVADMRSSLSRQRHAKHPDARLSSVTELAYAAGIDPVDILSYERSRQLDRATDDARGKLSALKKRGK